MRSKRGSTKARGARVGGVEARRKTPLLAAAVAVAVALAVPIVHRLRAEPGEVAAPARGEVAAPVRTQAEAPARAAARSLPPPPSPVTDPRLPSGPVEDGEYPVDLEALRARMPDNLYWKLGAPTEDPMVLQQRAEEEHRWNEMLGKVQSGTATEEEIREYYDHRRALSEDYLEFATAVLDEYRGRLPERDVGMYELSQKLHRSRLAEIPRKIEEALARKKEQDARRAAWRGQGQGQGQAN